jgi:hypothetical protein
MADKSMPAGKYELHADAYPVVGKDGSRTMYRRGDIVELSTEDAERLKDVIAKPGERQRAQAKRLRAQADALAKQAEEADAKAKDAAGDARSAAKAS